MAKMTEAVVMLGPPNRGSKLAHLGRICPVRIFNASLADMTTNVDSLVLNIPVPPFLSPIGIVAGKFDEKVALDSTPLPAGQPRHRRLHPIRDCASRATPCR